jgi:hypothetical protein
MQGDARSATTTPEAKFEHFPVAPESNGPGRVTVDRTRMQSWSWYHLRRKMPGMLMPISGRISREKPTPRRRYWGNASRSRDPFHGSDPLLARHPKAIAARGAVHYSDYRLSISPFRCALVCSFARFQRCRVRCCASMEVNWGV